MTDPRTDPNDLAALLAEADALPTSVPAYDIPDSRGLLETAYVEAVSIAHDLAAALREAMQQLDEAAVAYAKVTLQLAAAEADVRRLREVVTELRQWCFCEHMHHEPEEYHSVGTACPVEARIDAASGGQGSRLCAHPLLRREPLACGAGDAPAHLSQLIRP